MLLAGILIYAATIAGFVWYLKKLDSKARAEQYDHQPDDARFTPTKHPAMTAPITRKCDIKAVTQEVFPPARRVRKPVKNQGVSSSARKQSRERKTVTVKKRATK
jgi:hypothetical protein